MQLFNIFVVEYEHECTNLLYKHTDTQDKQCQLVNVALPQMPTNLYITKNKK